MMIICPNCGAFIEDNLVKCSECGFNLGENPLDSLNDEAMTNIAVKVVQESEMMTDIISDLNDIDTVETDISEKSSDVITDILSDNPTNIQTLIPILTHVQTNIIIEIPLNLEIVHIGKPNDKNPPDIDVSGFPHSQVVSRIHANLIQDGEIFYIEDTGSANGTYINHTPLPTGNRHRLKSGDRIALGKEDKVSFIFDFKM